MQVKKYNKTALRVLEILKTLLHSSMSYDDIFAALDEEQKYFDCVYTKGVLQKYFNTFRLIGFDVLKKDKKYFAVDKNKSIEFSNSDFEQLVLLENFVEYSSNLRYKKSFYNFTSILSRYIPKNEIDSYNLTQNVKKITTFIDSRYKIIITKLEKYIQDGLKLKIEYNADKQTIAPKQIVYSQDKVYLLAYSQTTNQNRKFDITKIKIISQTPQKTCENYSLKTVVFKLYGRLAKTYVLKENEKIIQEGNFVKDEIIVSNNSEDIDFLLRRLLRYKDNCEILQPKDVKQKFLNLINDIEKIYE